MIINREKNYLLYRIAISHILTIIALCQKNISALAVFIIWIVSAVFPNFMLSFTKNLKAIEINQNSVCLIFNQYFNEVREIHEYKNLNFTYKIETGGKGSRSWQFRIYKKGYEKSTVNIGGMFDGWTDDKISDIITELKKNGVIVSE